MYGEARKADARKAQVIVPPLSAFERQQAVDLSREIRFPSPATSAESPVAVEAVP